ncbi:MAG: DUF1993 domain-containing protein [Sphingomonadales bacterium]|nr:DUF1993 domain-containing protein [Sphingomonadales bacterium]MDE2568321.1 DUF1993 domain-containing protein [Sphingomonadales bacterium]
MRLGTFTLASFSQMLGTFDHLLGKAAGDPRGGALLTSRLCGDMFPLASQVRFATQQVVNTLNRLAGADLKGADTDHATLAEAHAHIAGIVAALSATSPEAFVADDTPVEFDLPNGMAFRMTAEEYVRDWSLPQFYFHVTTAYAILRMEGVPLGKADYVGYIARHMTAPTAA